MLQKIGLGTLISPFTLLIDSAEHKGKTLLWALVQSLSEHPDHEIHVLCWENSVRELSESPLNGRSNVYIHDCFTDAWGWLDNANLCASQGLVAFLQERITSNDKKVTVVIDSLSSALFSIGYGLCMKELQRVISQPIKTGVQVTQLLCLVHGDLLPGGESTLPLLKHVATTYTELCDGVACTTHRKPGSHVKKKKETYTILRTGEINVQPYTPVQAPTFTSPSENLPAKLPQDVASFRVELNDSEREARSRLVLPYQRVEDNMDKGSGGGKIFYQPDAGDDWDEEDPDDDLEI